MALAYFKGSRTREVGLISGTDRLTRASLLFVIPHSLSKSTYWLAMLQECWVGGRR
jgi:hypothetical protein